MNQKIERTSDCELLMTRTFAAPRQLVWEAYTDCRHLSQWWGPTGWTVPHCELDLRPGGTWHYCMKGPMPDGSVMESWGLTTYEEIDAPKRLVYRDAFSDAEGNISADFPQTTVVLTLEEVDGGTLLTSTARYASAADLDTVLAMGMEEGLSETWQGLDAYLESLE